MAAPPGCNGSKIIVKDKKHDKIDIATNKRSTITYEGIGPRSFTNTLKKEKHRKC